MTVNRDGGVRGGMGERCRGFKGEGGEVKTESSLSSNNDTVESREVKGEDGGDSVERVKCNRGPGTGEGNNNVTVEFGEGEVE